VASLSALWARELQRFLGPFPCNAGVNAPCCAQFLVRSERLRAVPLGAWRALLNVSMGRQDPEYKAHAGAAVFDLATAKRWEDVRQLEFLWGILLGEPCVSPQPRQPPQTRKRAQPPRRRRRPCARLRTRTRKQPQPPPPRTRLQRRRRRATPPRRCQRSVLRRLTLKRRRRGALPPRITPRRRGTLRRTPPLRTRCAQPQLL
jgi:hypothetical protein